MTQASTAIANTATIDSLPPAANAPATTSVGIAGTGIPICSTKTFANTTASPYWLTREARSFVTGCVIRACSAKLGYILPAKPPLRNGDREIRMPALLYDDKLWLNVFFAAEWAVRLAMIVVVPFRRSPE